MQELISEGNACRGSLNCPEGITFFNNQAKTCQSCEAGCAKCDKRQCLEKCSDTCGDCFLSADNCISCKGDQILVKLADGNSTCRDKCDDGEFYDAEQKMCVSCMDDCAMCNNTTDCLQCNDGLKYLLGSDGEDNLCLEQCPEGYFVDEDGNCKSCPAGCSSCSSENECETCNAYTTLQDGQCVCEFNYEIKARPTFHYIQFDFFNIIWETETNVTSGSKFNCSDIFDFEYKSSVDFDLSDLRCYGKDLSDEEKLKQRVTIRSNFIEQLELLVNEDVKVSLNTTAFSQACEGVEDLETTLDFPKSTSSCNSCGCTTCSAHWDL